MNGRSRLRSAIDQSLDSCKASSAKKQCNNRKENGTRFQTLFRTKRERDHGESPAEFAKNARDEASPFPPLAPVSPFPGRGLAANSCSIHKKEREPCDSLSLFDTTTNRG
jgi:hypothetical protein